MQRLFLVYPIKPATNKQLYSLLFSIFWLPLTLLGQEKYYVYSVTGEALIMEKNSNRKIQIFDKLNDNSSVIIRGNSKISFIAESTSKYYEINTPGTYPIKTIIRQPVKQSNATENVLKYIYSKFIEKGKIYHGDPQYKTIGVILRGDEENYLLFPFDKTLLLYDQSFVPILSDSHVKIKNEFTVLLSQNGQSIREFIIKQ